MFLSLIIQPFIYSIQKYPRLIMCYLLILVQVLILSIFLFFWTSCGKISFTFYDFFYVISSYGKAFEQNFFLFVWKVQYFQQKTFQFSAFLQKTFFKIIFQQQAIQEKPLLRQNSFENMEQTLLQQSFLKLIVLEQASKELIFEQQLHSFLNQNFQELTSLETPFSLIEQ